jgi:hypothetical protein
MDDKYVDVHVDVYVDVHVHVPRARSATPRSGRGEATGPRQLEIPDHT